MKLERRSVLRRHTIAPCHLSIEGIRGYIAAQVHNIGQHGAFLKLEDKPKHSILHKEGELTIFDGNRPNVSRIKAWGKIAHEDGNGMGFYICRIDAQNFSQLKLLIEQASELGLH